MNPFAPPSRATAKRPRGATAGDPATMPALFHHDAQVPDSKGYWTADAGEIVARKNVVKSASCRILLDRPGDPTDRSPEIVAKGVVNGWNLSEKWEVGLKRRFLEEGIETRQCVEGFVSLHCLKRRFLEEGIETTFTSEE